MRSEYVGSAGSRVDGRAHVYRWAIAIVPQKFCAHLTNTHNHNHNGEATLHLNLLSLSLLVAFTSLQDQPRELARRPATTSRSNRLLPSVFGYIWRRHLHVQFSVRLSNGHSDLCASDVLICTNCAANGQAGISGWQAGVPWCDNNPILDWAGQRCGWFGDMERPRQLLTGLLLRC